jgi:hypothetical protein
VPQAREIGERLGDDQAVALGQALDARVLGMQPAQRVGVRRGEQRARRALARVAHGPQPRAVRHAEGPLDHPPVALARAGRLDEPDRPLERADRVLVEAERQRELEDHLGVRRPLDVGEQLRVDAEHEIAPDLLQVGDESVVHEEPPAVPERVAVRLLDRRADGGTNVREEQRRLDVTRELAQVRVRPRRRDAAVDPRTVTGAVPAQTEPVAVRGLRAQPRVQALVDDPVLGLEEQLVHEHVLTQPRHPAAHVVSIGRGRSLRRPRRPGQP